MEVNKEQAEKCRDIGATALRNGDQARAVKFLTKSLKLYPLPGVEALLAQANSSSNSGSSSADPPPRATAPQQSAASSSASSSSNNVGVDGREYTAQQEQVVKTILRNKEGGRGAHYRVLGLSQQCTESELKKAYRKLSLKVHPDKNPAPHASEAFKAVGLAYATLSDSQKRAIYDRYGEEDPDNRGGGAGFRRGPGGVHMNGAEVSPEDIFNMFFGGGMGGMHAGGPGVHVYSNGFGRGGVRFGGMPQQQQQRRRQRQGGAEQQNENPSVLGLLIQFLPIFLILLMSFFQFNDDTASAVGGGRSMPGENKYFSLTNKNPFVNPLVTRLVTVKDIPYFVSDRFMRTYHRDRYQLSQVERMVENAYEAYLVSECRRQREHKRRLELAAANKVGTEEERARELKRAEEYELSRCTELQDLFPRRQRR